ncbi:MAG: terminase family protein [Pseudomonadota bacterium]
MPSLPEKDSHETLLLQILETLSDAELEFLEYDWPLWAKRHQLPRRKDWTSWLILGGRGAGKTRAGAEWVRAMALGLAPFADEPHERIALVGETYDDARDVMVEGVSGLLAIHPKAQRPAFEKSRGVLTWPNGAQAQIFSAQDPDGLRGPQFHAAWCDEIAKWRYVQDTWDMLQFALRLSDRPQQVVTTTPRPLPLLKKLMSDKRCVVTRATTNANAENLSPVFLKHVLARYKNTRLWRQEVLGEIIAEREDALWSREMIESARVVKAPELKRIVLALDPAATSGKNADACGLVAAGQGENEQFYVLEDATLVRARPDVWAAKAVALYHRLQADALYAESNQGGEMIEAVLRAVDENIPVKRVHATRGKYLRAEPVAALYARGLVHHVGAYPELEDEMCDFSTDGLSGGRSPDRLDALVWAISALQKTVPEPVIRRL